MSLLLINKKTLSVLRGDVQFAEGIIGVDSEQIAWALEEYNRCDCGDWVAIEEEYSEDHPAG